MDNETILQKAIEKAVKNGYVKHDADFQIVVSEEYEKGINNIIGFSRLGIIYSHDFAKAFFKNEAEAYQCPNGCDEQGNKEDHWFTKKFCDKCGTKNEKFIIDMGNWKTKLQQMVVSEDPIKYLENYL